MKVKGIVIVGLAVIAGIIADVCIFIIGFVRKLYESLTHLKQVWKNNHLIIYSASFVSVIPKPVISCASIEPE